MTKLTDEQVVEKIRKRMGAGQHDWSTGLGSDENPQIGFIPQCNLCMIAANESGSEERCALVDVPPYLSSRDALAPVLAGLSDDEWARVWWILSPKCTFKIRSRNVSRLRHHLTLPPRDLAHAIAEAIQ